MNDLGEFLTTEGNWILGNWDTIIPLVYNLGVVDREWALCMRHQISLPPTILVIDNLCTVYWLPAAL